MSITRLFVALALFVSVVAGPSYLGAQAAKSDSAKTTAVQWLNALLQKDEDGIRRTTTLPLYFDDMAPLTDAKQVSSAFMTALAPMVRPNVKERVGFKPGSPRTIPELLTGKNGPPDDQMLKSMSLRKEDSAVPVAALQGEKQIGTLFIVVRNSKVVRVFTAVNKN
jgi:hypothetical protein